MAGFPERLDTPRLVLRPAAPDDLPAVVPLASEWEVARQTARIPHPYDAAAGAAWLAQCERDWAAGAGFTFALIRKSDAALVGMIGVERPRRQEAILGYWIGRPFWAQGYGREAAARVVAFAFEELKAARVAAGARPENVASVRILESVGMRYVGTRREPAPARGGELEVLAFALDRAGWSRHAALPAVLVAAVALVDPDGRVLLAKRPPGKAMAGLWEFPGGKVHAGETPEAALIRELREELGIETETSCLAPFTFASHLYEDFHLLMPLYVCRVWQGRPTPHEGQDLAWVRPARMGDYPMPPADRPLVAMLRDLL